MRQPRNEMPTRLEAGDVCIQAQDWGGMNVARIRFPKGADATPLLAPAYADSLLAISHADSVFFSLPVGGVALAPNSSASRTPSPIRLMAITRLAIAIAGKNVDHQ